MKNIKKMLAVILTALIVVSVLPTVSNAASKINYKTTSYAYYNPGLKSNIATVEVTGLTSKQKITKGSVTSSNTAVGKIRSYTRRVYKSSTSKVDSKSKSSSSERYSYTIKVRLYSVGSTVISYTIDGKEYHTTLLVEEFVNPVKSIKITGVNSSKNFTKSFDFSKGYGVAEFSSPSQKSKLTVTANTGWRVVSLDYENLTTGYEYSKYNSSKKKVLKSISLGKLSSSCEYNINAVLEDEYGNSVRVVVKLGSPAENVL